MWADPTSCKFLKMKTLFAILFFIATGLYVCLSYLLMQLIDMNSKSGFVMLDVLGLFANIMLINFLFRKYINQPFHKRPDKALANYFWFEIRPNK